MLDMTQSVEEKIAFYEKDIDNRFSVNGFQGTWAFSDHSLIPQVFNGFLQRYYGVARIKRIKLDDINTLLNELWDGPGSLAKIFRMENEMYMSGKDIKFSASDILKAKKIEKDEEEFDDLPLAQFTLEDSDYDEE